MERPWSCGIWRGAFHVKQVLSAQRTLDDVPRGTIEPRGVAPRTRGLMGHSEQSLVPRGTSISLRRPTPVFHVEPWRTRNDQSRLHTQRIPQAPVPPGTSLKGRFNFVPFTPKLDFGMEFVGEATSNYFIFLSHTKQRRFRDASHLFRRAFRVFP